MDNQLQRMEFPHRIHYLMIPFLLAYKIDRKLSDGIIFNQIFVHKVTYHNRQFVFAFLPTPCVKSHMKQWCCINAVCQCIVNSSIYNFKYAVFFLNTWHAVINQTRTYNPSGAICHYTSDVETLRITSYMLGIDSYISISVLHILRFFV